VHENVFAARPLNKPVSLSSVKPLHNTVLFHWDSFIVCVYVVVSAPTRVCRLPLRI
jgi:hypothetical protein